VTVPFETTSGGLRSSLRMPTLHSPLLARSSSVIETLALVVAVVVVVEAVVGW